MVLRVEPGGSGRGLFRRTAHRPILIRLFPKQDLALVPDPRLRQLLPHVVHHLHGAAAPPDRAEAERRARVLRERMNGELDIGSRPSNYHDAIVTKY